MLQRLGFIHARYVSLIYVLNVVQANQIRSHWRSYIAIMVIFWIKHFAFRTYSKKMRQVHINKIFTNVIFAMLKTCSFLNLEHIIVQIVETMIYVLLVVQVPNKAKWRKYIALKVMYYSRHLILNYWIQIIKTIIIIVVSVLNNG